MDINMNVTVEHEVIVWFACKSCSPTPSFPNLRAFIAHKKCSHSEFKNTKCVVLEERTTILTHNFYKDGSECLEGVQPPCDLVTIEIKTEPESILSDPPASPELNDDHFQETESLQLTTLPSQSPTADADEFLQFPQINNLPNENSDLPDSSWEDPFPDDNTSNATGHNPYVLIKRLTPKKIPKASCFSLSYPRPRRQVKTNSNKSAPTTIRKRDAKPFQSLSTEIQEQLLLNSNCECKLCHIKCGSDKELRDHIEMCWFDKKGNHCRRYCVPCQKMFPFPSKLQEHLLRFHAAEAEKTEAKKFECLLCPMKFIRSRELLVHEEQRHSNKEERERPFLCLECGRAFFKKFQLTQHIRIHSDNRPFKCPVENCGKAFLYNGSLKEHIDCVHNNGVTERFKCTVESCKKTFKYKNDRTKHVKKIHPDMSPIPPMCRDIQNNAQSLIKVDNSQDPAQDNQDQEQKQLALLT